MPAGDRRRDPGPRRTEWGRKEHAPPHSCEPAPPGAWVAYVPRSDGRPWHRARVPQAHRPRAARSAPPRHVRLRERPARQISSGEAQRVSLARALVLEPDLLLLDEPFASVDAATRGRLLDDLEVLLRETRVSCVIVTHDLDEAVRLGDRMAVMVAGRIRQVDPPERVLAEPLDEDVAAFVGVETRLRGRVISSEEGVAVVDVGGMHVEAVSALAPGRDVLCCLRPEDVTLWSSGSQAAPSSVASSARNQVRGRVSRMVTQGSLVRVSVDIGSTLVASITRASAADLGLVEGAAVLATFKASAVHLIPLAG